MASSLFVLLDDIATILDDVSAMTKVAAKKTAGVLGDDLALNAEQVSGVRADRELPVVWAVAKGSVRNKLILVPAALAISNTPVPTATTPIARAMRAPAGARRSAATATVTAAITRRSMTPMTRRIAIRPAQQKPQ